MIYRLRYDRFNFLVGDISFEEIKSKTGNYFALDAPEWAPIWKQFEIKFRDDSDDQNVLVPPDITCWFTNELFLNSAAYKKLEDVLAPYGELLPVYCEGVPYWVFHVTKKTGMNAINIQLSNREVEDGGYIDVQSLHFNEALVNNLLLFKTEFNGYRNIYCTEKFKTLVDAAGLKGLLFSTDLAGLIEP
ncbi:MAG: hypothetical protein EOP48_10140 [Sphingobacteriales bacterium]|nr:MAG: hypothetical protein EOP48_10140 [Sphingobacteriales bacterium]